MSLSWILLLTCMAQALLVIIWILLSMNCAWKYRAKQSAGSISRSQGTGDIERRPLSLLPDQNEQKVEPSIRFQGPVSEWLRFERPQS